MYTLYSKYMHTYMYNKSYIALFNVTKSSSSESSNIQWFFMFSFFGTHCPSVHYLYLVIFTLNLLAVEPELTSNK